MLPIPTIEYFKELVHKANLLGVIMRDKSMQQCTIIKSLRKERGFLGKILKTRFYSFRFLSNISNFINGDEF